MNRFVHTFTSSIRPSTKSTRQQQYYYSSTNLCAKRKSNATGNKQTFRADRVLSNRGMGSRSECFELLKQKRVFQKLDGNDSFTLVKGPSEKVSMNASLWIDRKNEVPKPAPLLRIYNKPKWVLSVMNDNKGRKHVGELDFITKMHPVGRLDYDTSGLLLFSSDGKLTQHLLHPNHEIEKEYVALVVGKVDEESLRETLAKGVSTSLGVFPAKLVNVHSIPLNQVQPLISDIIDSLPDEYDLSKLEENGYLFFKNATELSEVRLVVQEGMFYVVFLRVIVCQSNIHTHLSHYRETSHGTKNIGQLWFSSHWSETGTSRRYMARRLTRR